ncbi:hypothetical protein H2200_008826 [Cladophialophora chaetospira]|uniref:Uncharacterized protein n=1 Tax=Cladophialophora chaetospira TaxID=386627 RepID=A0AA38X4T4_9EURO|nr:hypothetical protein H2200_008826 [Cladophialophora chaetospira]
MHLSQILLCWLGLGAATAIGHEQEYIGSDHLDKYNLSLTFDDLPTNASGIGYNGETNYTPLHYGDLYFQSFTVVNVAKAQEDLPNPVDLLCASSAPNALFSHRHASNPWPRFSLHSLTDPSLPRDPNVTFTMRSIDISPVGSIPQNGLVIIWLNLLKLPPDDALDGGKNILPWPELAGGAPIYAQGRIFQLVAFFGPGPHPNVYINYDNFRRYNPEMGTKVDTFEVYAQLLKRSGPNEPYSVVADWEICLDNVVVEIAKKAGDKDDEEAGGASVRTFVLAGENGEVLDYQDEGQKLMKELRL